MFLQLCLPQLVYFVLPKALPSTSMLRQPSHNTGFVSVFNIETLVAAEKREETFRRNKRIEELGVFLAATFKSPEMQDPSESP